MKEIKIIDAPCGAGKSSWAIQYMNENTDKRFIYVSPFLDQVDRIKDECYNRVFKDPDAQKGKGSKLEHLRILVENGCNISTTHSLFRYIDKDISEKIKEMNYILLLDEVINVIEKHYVNRVDLEMMFDKGLVSVENGTNRILWNESIEYEEGRFEQEKKLLINGDCYLSNRSSDKSKKELLMWTFPVSVFSAFSDVYVMTYLFQAQYQYSYYRLNNIEFKYYSIEKEDNNYTLTDYVKDDRSRFKDLINICDNEMLNKIGLKNGRANPLSTSWYQKCAAEKSDSFEVIKKNIINYVRNICKAKSDEVIWTTFKDYRSKLKGKGYSKSFISVNCRATNQYKERNVVIYPVNLFMNPVDKGFFEERNIEINQDLWALSELVQFLFRSAIRDDNPINIYIPSDRMRNLLIDWIENKI